MREDIANNAPHCQDRIAKIATDGECDIRNSRGMDANWLKHRIAGLHKTQADLARVLGVDPAAISRMMKGERQLQASEALAVARFLEVTIEFLHEKLGSPIMPGASKTDEQKAADLAQSARDQKRQNDEMWRIPPPPREVPPKADMAAIEAVEITPLRQEGPLPILGNALGGGGAMHLDQGNVQGTTPRPVNLSGIKAAFAVYMTGDSMEPRYSSGELLYIHPSKPVSARNYVLIEMKDHTAYVKRFIKRDDKAITVEQLNPAKKITFPVETVLHIYRVVGAIE